MKTERVISRFDKTTELLLDEVNIDTIDLNALKGIFNPPLSDPLMYEPYTITLTEADKLNNLISIDFDLNRYTYQVDCFQV